MVPIRPQISRDRLAALLGSSPHCGAIGLSIADDDAAVQDLALILPARNAHRLRAGEAIWHPGVIGSALDTALSMAALTIIDPESRPATVDLRWDLLGDIPFGDLMVVATSGQTMAGRAAPDIVFTEGEIIHIATGDRIGQAQACIAYAPPVNGESGRMTTAHRETSDAPDFATWIGLDTDEAGMARISYRDALGGAVGLPYWHGGALTAGMMAAAVDRAEHLLPGSMLMTVTASFNLFAIDQPILLDTSDSRSTRTRASIQVACAQEGRGITTRLAAHFGKRR